MTFKEFIETFLPGYTDPGFERDDIITVYDENQEVLP